VGPPHEVYALGHLLWELLSGRRLIDAENDFQVLVQISKGVLPEPFLPPALGALEPALRRALDVDPGRRHATPGAFADDIEAAVAPASSEEVAAWLATLGGELARRQVELRDRIAGLHAPPHGYFVLEQWATTEHATIYVAVRSGPRGPEMIALRRGHPVLMSDPSQAERFLSEVSLAIDGIAHIDDAGFDAAGHLFRAQPFVCGLDLAQVLRRIHPSHATPTPAIAVAVIGEAARALQRALSLPAPEGATVSVIGKYLAPSSLRIGIDGRPVWTSLGVAPSADFVAPRRSDVPLVAAAGLGLDGLSRPAAEPLVGRSVVVPRSTVAATPATAPPGPPRPRRLRWWS
jgi:hypothetical protein